MRYWYREKDWVYIGFEYNRCFIDMMKKEFKAKYNIATKEWYFQIGLEDSFKLKSFLELNRFENRKVVLPCEIELKESSKAIDEDILREMIEYLDFPMKPRDYQIEGITYMINHGNCINGCECGTGKTMQSILYVEVLDLFPCLVICPSSVKSSWLKEWKQWNPNRTIHVIDSKDGENTDWKADVTIINYDYLYKRGKSKEEIKLRYSRSLSKKWGTVILDEIHLCKNPKSLRSRSVKKIVKKSTKVLALSGTLIMNRPQELINVLDILGRFKEIFPSLQYFLYRYCNAKKTRFGLDCSGASYTLELNSIISHYCYFRKSKRDVLTELPDVINQTVNCPITNKKEYKQAEDDLITYLEGIDIEAAERALKAEHLVRISNLKRLSLEGKLNFIEQFLKDWTESNEDDKIIVFGTLKEPLKQLYQKFKDESELVVGECSTEEKMNKVERWKKEKQILFANTATLSTGVDGLQKVCSNMIFVEYPVGPTDLEQAISRLERMGQKNSINVYFLLSDETIDTRIGEIFKEKSKVINAVNKGTSIVEIDKIQSIDMELLKSYKSN
jgi:SWI/SNF-related matrix-associated actin-dependent regulator 1 of chromatin subfamily A|uniref:Chromatin remodeling complex ATPase n=1 Tax=Siphoviridae sp. ct3r22 TaxID=2825325 RepID=A0A8S5V0U1_9CAUD|nr:MAG TPA: Chromatin remodeling complex ATPase [Siphoviridae sp. ct3r22]